MYQMREMREGSSLEKEEDEEDEGASLLKVMYCLRREGREPGSVASSILSWASVSRSTVCWSSWADRGRLGGGVGEVAVTVIVVVVAAAAAVGIIDKVDAEVMGARVDGEESVSAIMAAVSPASGRLVGAEGWEMAFWPVI